MNALFYERLLTASAGTRRAIEKLPDQSLIQHSLSHGRRFLQIGYSIYAEFTQRLRLATNVICDNISMKLDLFVHIEHLLLDQNVYLSA